MINMENREKIFHNKLVHYNPIHFPNGMKKAFYNAMQEYSDQQNKQLLDEIDMLKFQLKAADSVNEQKDKEIAKLKFMVSNGLGFEDLRNDI